MASQSQAPADSQTSGSSPGVLADGVAAGTASDNSPDTLRLAFDKSIMNVEKRFPTVQGARRLDLCKSLFGVRTMLNATIPWCDPTTGRRNFVRHMDVNDREQKETLSQQVKNILTWGIANDARGVPMRQLSEGDVPPYRLFSFAHLATAFYHAAEHHRGNENVKAALEKGLTRVQVYQCQAPLDALVWMKDFMNFDWNQKAGINYVETLEWARKITADLAAHEHMNPGWASGNDESRRQKVWKWICDNYKDQVKQGIIPSNVFYELCRFISERFAEIDQADPGHDGFKFFRSLMLETCVFGDGRVRNSSVLECLKILLTTWTNLLKGKPINQCIDPAVLRILMEESFKFLVPTLADDLAVDVADDDGGGKVLDRDAAKVSWVLQKPSRTTTMKKILFADISGGKFYKRDKPNAKHLTQDQDGKRRKLTGKQPSLPKDPEKPKEEKSKPDENKSEEQGQDKGKEDKKGDAGAGRGRGRRGGGAGRGQAAGGAVELKHLEAVQKLATAAGMRISWLEDVILAMNAAVSDAMGSKGVTSAMRTTATENGSVEKAKRMFIRISFEFAWKRVSGWCAVRDEAKRLTTDKLKKMLIPDRQDSSEDAQDRAPQTAMEIAIDTAFGDEQFCETLRTFLDANPHDTPVTFLPCFMEVSQQTWKGFEHDMKDEIYRRNASNVKQPLANIITWITKAISSVGLPTMEDEYMDPIPKIAFVWADAEAYPNFSSPEVVDELLDLETAQGYLSLRAKLMAEVTCSVLARSKSKGISWTTSQGGGDALQPEAVDSLMSVLKAEVQKDLLFSELQVLDLRTAGRGRSVWISVWAMILDSIAAKAIADPEKTATDPKFLEMAQLSATVQTVFGIAEASKAAQEEFEKQIAELELVEAAPPQPSALRLGTLSELMGHQSASLVGNLKGERLRAAQAVAHSTWGATPCILKLPEHEITAAFVKQLATHLESELFNLAFQPEDDIFEHVDVEVLPPSGAGAGKAPAATLVSTRELAENFTLYFAGNVEPTRGKASSFHIVTIAGLTPDGEDESAIQIPLFLNYNPAEHDIAGPCPIPSWMVETVEDAEQQQVQQAKGKGGRKRKSSTGSTGAEAAAPPSTVTPILAVNVNIIEFELPEYLCSGPDGDISKVPVRVFYLGPTAHALCQKAPLKLNRAVIPGEKAEKSKGKGKGKDSKGAVKSSSDVIGGLGMAARYDEVLTAKSAATDTGANQSQTTPQVTALEKAMEGVSKCDYLHLLK
ncbi:unnamed protein product [Prorocentrum cordatum]|uniref:Uncharacterized protein n=1 Tax=Prorocentrum cordatum TaxID=2364126 RepID=A0ABN9WC40_9DINO|nr:unnamed protein product [Polarella glacialis]